MKKKYISLINNSQEKIQVITKAGQYLTFISHI